jgi:ribosomal protein S18 acetylase RimI-like enzyme
MGFIKVDETNIDREHICCAITDKKGETCVSSKKAWMKRRFEDGLVFQKLDERGKVFIEYIPAEKAWCPIEADGYFYIDCFWVSGQFKGKGYADRLLELCITDAKEKGAKGLAVLSSEKKMPFLSDPKYLKYKGFRVADRAEPYFELLYLNFNGSDTQIPRFKSCAKDGRIDMQEPAVYYSNQCPHTDKYAPLLLETAKEHDIPLRLIKIDNTEVAQNAPTPFTTYSFFLEGRLITNEILTEKKFLEYIKNARR